MTHKNQGRLYLVPSPLIEGHLDAIPVINRLIVSKCRHFLVESLKLGRRHVKAMVPDFDFSNSHFYELNKDTAPESLKALIQPVVDGHDLCVLSDAGSPVIADPGSNIVMLAHRLQIGVVPLSGPSSVMLALMASGLNGQNFVFHGYLSREKGKLRNQLKKLEQGSRQGVTQIFMETPYRNNSIFDQIILTCNPELLLSIACDLTSENSLIKTQTISQWQKAQKPDLHKRPCIFLLGI